MNDHHDMGMGLWIFLFWFLMTIVLFLAVVGGWSLVKNLLEKLNA